MPEGMPRPPVSPDAQAQMGPPGGPGFGPGVAQAQAQMDKSPADVAVATCEKILLGVPDESFKAAAVKAIAQLKIAASQAQQKQGMAPPPGAGAPMVAGPPTPGQMAG